MLMRWARALGFAAAIGLSASAGQAQSPAEFYKGKTVEVYIGFSVGGAYDGYARLLARHMGKHLPGNPTLVPKNMEGAGSLRLANWLAGVAPKDGSVIAIIARGTAFDPLLGRGGAQFDATKLSWIGSANDEVSICTAWHTTPVATFEDLTAKEMIVGGTGGSADTDQFPRVLNGVFGTKMKVISGYPGGNDINLAMERGEVQGRCGWSWSSVGATHPTWLTEKKIKILAQMSLAKHPDLPDVPLIMDFAKTEEQRQILRLDLRPPGHGPSLRGAARHPGRSPRGPAPGLHGHHEGSRIPGRGGEGRLRDHARARRGDPEARRGGLPDPEGRGRQSRRHGEIAACRRRVAVARH